MKKSITFVALLAIVIVGYAGAGPFIAIHQIESGIEQQDTEKLSEYIDFSMLRTNLKEQFNALFMKQAASDLKDNPFAAVVTAFASKLVEGMADSFVTPSGLANLMAGKKPKQPQGRKAPQQSQKPEPFKNARYTYDSSSKFSAWVREDKGEEIRFVLTRDGLSWKLSNILIPTGLFGGNMSASAEPQSREEPNASTPKPGEPPAFKVALRKKAFREANYMAGVQDAVTFAVAFQNLSGKDIRAFDGVLGFIDLLDNDIVSARLAINDAVAVNAILEWEGELHYNQFMDSHRHLKNEDFANLKIYFKTRKILFADGTIKEFE